MRKQLFLFISILLFAIGHVAAYASACGKNTATACALELFGPTPSIVSPAVCDTTPQVLTYTLKNNTPSTIALNNIELKKIDEVVSTVVLTGGTCLDDMRLNAQDTCTIIVTVTPVCGDNATQMVNQQLIVDPDINQSDLIEDILLEITPILLDSYAYVANSGGDSGEGRVLKCGLITSGPSTGLFDDCIDSGASGTQTPFNTTFQTVAGTLYANISDYFDVPILCDVDLLGQLSNCIDNNPDALINSPIDMAFNTSDALYAYITVPNDVQPWLYKCGVVSSSGLLENCVEVDQLEQDAYGITFQAFNGVNYAYIANGLTSGSGSVTQCQVLPNGDFQSPCTLNVPETGASNIVFAEVNGVNYAYITLPPTNEVSKCDVDPTDGTLSFCVSMAGSFATPNGIALHMLGTQLYAYIASTAGNIVLVCPIDATNYGNFGTCTDAGFAFDQPQGITFQTF
ncbi:MAG: hypothetical protein WC748_08070 [Legionellales bacterium]